MQSLKLRKFVVVMGVVCFTSIVSYISYDSAQLSRKYENIAFHLSRATHTTSIDVAKVEIDSVLDGIVQSPRLSYLLAHENKRLFWDSSNFQQ